MSTNKNSRWLKKYTKLEHLQSILENNSLHLGKPKRWPDKNDSELIRLYSKESGFFETRATCLTAAADRYHFWVVFGECKHGVCLWFDRERFLKDLEGDETLIANQVQYMTLDELSQVNLDTIPFAKRQQYADEREFRVLRRYPIEGPDKDGVAFSTHSLRKIYLNPWLNGKHVKQKKDWVSAMLTSGYEHVDVLQNRSLRRQRWINAARSAAKS